MMLAREPLAATFVITPPTRVRSRRAPALVVALGLICSMSAGERSVDEELRELFDVKKGVAGDGGLGNVRPSDPGEENDPVAEGLVCARRPYRFLVLEGGGVKGIAYGGAMCALEEAGVLKTLEGYSGSSAGSQIAALLAAGYSGEEMVDEMMKVDFPGLLDDSSWLTIPNPVEDIRRMFSRFGWYKGQAIRSRIDERFYQKTGIHNISFAELYEHTGKALRITATCVNTGTLHWFDRETAPDMPVSKAVQASSAIPFIFTPVEHEGRMYVDGGLLRNLPHDAFSPSLGSKLALSLRKNGLRGVPVRENITTIVQFAMQLAETVLLGPDSANSLVDMDEDSRDLDMVHVWTTVNTVDFGLNATQRAQLVEQGYVSVHKRLVRCGHIEAAHGDSDHRPKWLLQLLAEAQGEGGKDKRKKGRAWLPTGAQRHMEAVRRKLDDMASGIRPCVRVQSEEKGNKCGVDVKRLTGQLEAMRTEYARAKSPSKDQTRIDDTMMVIRKGVVQVLVEAAIEDMGLASIMVLIMILILISAGIYKGCGAYHRRRYVWKRRRRARQAPSLNDLKEEEAERISVEDVKLRAPLPARDGYALRSRTPKKTL